MRETTNVSDGTAAIENEGNLENVIFENNEIVRKDVPITRISSGGDTEMSGGIEGVTSMARNGLTYSC